MAKLKRRAQRSGRLELALGQAKKCEADLQRLIDDTMPTVAADSHAQLYSATFLRALAALQQRIADAKETNAAVVYQDLRCGLAKMYDDIRAEFAAAGPGTKDFKELVRVRQQALDALVLFDGDAVLVGDVDDDEETDA